MTMQQYVTINGVDVTARLNKWRLEETFGQSVRQIKMVFNKGIFNDIPDLRNGHDVVVKRGVVTSQDDWVFKGKVDTLNKHGVFVQVFARDELVNLINNNVEYSYDGVANPSTEAKGSDIAEDLIETWGEMTAEVVDTGTTLTIKKFICNDVDVYSRLQILADIYDYQFYYDPTDDKVHFEPKGFSSGSNPLVIGSNVPTVPKWNFDNTQCVNKLKIKGAVQSIETTEEFDGTGSQDEFELGKKPITVNVIVDGAEKTAGVQGSTSGTFDYTVDKENKKVVFESGSIPPSGTDNVVIKYTASIPIPVEVEDTDSQAKYGVFKATKHFTDIQSIEDAEARGNDWLSKYAEPFVKTTIRVVRQYDYEAGQTVTVQDSINNENRTLVINKIIKEYPHSGDQLILGDKEWRLAEWGKFTIERVRRLEEEMQKNTDLIVLIRTFPGNYFADARYVKFLKTTPGLGFLLGHPDKGELGDDVLGKGAGWVEDVLERLVHPFDKYIEEFYDTDFKDAANTTATWDTTNKQITF